MTAPGTRSVGGYSVERELGSGGMGQVLLGRQLSLDRPAVLKKLRRELAQSPEGMERFQREARAAAALHHPNVVSVYDCFSSRGDAYIALEYVDGCDLRALLAHCGALPARVAGWIALEVVRGLEAVHASGTVHRDLKPANVLVGRRGEVKIADFGIALDPDGPALTRSGIVLGTPAYMAPEQLQGERADARTDLFALGILLYEMLCGARPFEAPAADADESEALVARMRREDFIPLRVREPRVPRSMARLVRRLLRARARQRPASASRVRHELERLLRPPSAPDLHAALACWLWERDVFERRAGETVIQLGASAGTRRRPLWPVALAAGLAGAGVLGVRAAPVEPQLWGGQALDWAASVGALLRARPGASLHIEADEDVWIRIDGAAPQTAARLRVSLPAGPHRLLVGRPGVETRSHELSLAPGEQRSLDLSELLAPPADLTAP